MALILFCYSGTQYQWCAAITRGDNRVRRNYSTCATSLNASPAVDPLAPYLPGVYSPYSFRFSSKQCVFNTMDENEITDHVGAWLRRVTCSQRTERS